MIVTQIPHPTVRIERTISAAPQQVYDARLDPDLVRRWLAPDGWRVTAVEIDHRVGGTYRVRQQSPDGHAGGFEAQLLELVPPERIVWRWGFAGPDGAAGPIYDSRLTITLRAAPNNATTLALTHEQLEALSVALPHVADSVSTGWEMALDKLTTLPRKP